MKLFSVLLMLYQQLFIQLLPHQSELAQLDVNRIRRLDLLVVELTFRVGHFGILSS